jgi:hypothetical protein
MKAIPRALTAALAACAISLTLWSGVSTRAAAAVQATPMPSPVPTPMATAVPSPMATPVPSPMPNPAVTPAGNPVPTAPAPGTDMLNNNPNGNWLEKFNRTATPDPGMRPPAKMPLPSWCKALMKPGVKLTAAQRAKLKSQCMR